MIPTGMPPMPQDPSQLMGQMQPGMAGMPPMGTAPALDPNAGLMQMTAPQPGAPQMAAPLMDPSQPQLGAPPLGAPQMGAPQMGAPLMGAPAPQMGAPAPQMGAPAPQMGLADPNALAMTNMTMTQPMMQMGTAPALDPNALAAAGAPAMDPNAALLGMPGQMPDMSALGMQPGMDMATALAYQQQLALAQAAQMQALAMAGQVSTGNPALDAYQAQLMALYDPAAQYAMLLGGSTAGATGLTGLGTEAGDIDEDQEQIGILARFDEKGGYGFIKCKEIQKRFGRDAFVHKIHFQGVDVGDLVSFYVSVNDRGMPQARRVKKLEGEEAQQAEHKMAAAGLIDMQDYLGSVGRFDEGKGFGFINCDATKQKYGRDVFLRKQHFVDLELKVGDTVKFQVELNEKDMPQARTVVFAARPDKPAFPKALTPVMMMPGMTGPLAAANLPQPTYKPPAGGMPGMPMMGGGMMGGGMMMGQAGGILAGQIFTGTVTRIDKTKGFGFIKSDQTQALYNQDIFLHTSECGGADLGQGDTVSFTTELVPGKGPQARTVIKIASAQAPGMPMMSGVQAVPQVAGVGPLMMVGGPAPGVAGGMPNMLNATPKMGGMPGARNRSRSRGA
eukprot:TRINITY_DN12536_c0_g1_i3.p1 TRINITY_DN12536_c0_g1~~TRINITY_DN12536_c0_g1_i3.p1  ORF type:complete len:616 (-),score=164.19 TRINITY_DN12536_c0_g1_i3:127-1974(-)